MSNLFWISFDVAKGQVRPKNSAVDSLKKRKDQFDLFAVKSKKANKTNSSIPFFGKSMTRQSVF